MTSGERTICDGCGNEVDPDCCGCGGERDDPEHGGYDFTHSFVPMGCDCHRYYGRAVIAYARAPARELVLHGKPDRVLAKLVATLAYERDLAATGEPQRATALECGVALRDIGEGDNIAHLHWPSEKSMTPLLAYDGGAPVITDMPLVVTATSASEAPNWSMVIVFARDRGSYTL